MTRTISTLATSTAQALNTADIHIAATLGLIRPSLGASYSEGRGDAERGEITVAMVMWTSIAVLMAGGMGLLIWNKVKAKEASIDLNAPAAGIGQ